MSGYCYRCMVDLPWLHEQRDRSSETGAVDAWNLADGTAL